MTDKSQRIRIGSKSYWQFGFSSLVPDDGKIYGIKKGDDLNLVDLAEITGGGSVDAYTKAETDALLNTKQDTLSFVNPINIDEETNQVSLSINDTLKIEDNKLSIGDSATLQGNTFNGANQLVQLDESGKLPAIDGSQLTGIPKPVDAYTKTETNDLLSAKQDALTFLNPILKNDETKEVSLSINDTLKIDDNNKLSVADSATLQGNVFNGANQLVKLDEAGKLPAIDGSQLVNLNAYTKEESDELLAAKEDKLTAVTPLSIKDVVVNPTENMTIAESGDIVSNYTNWTSNSYRGSSPFEYASMPGLQAGTKFLDFMKEHGAIFVPFTFNNIYASPVVTPVGDTTFGMPPIAIGYYQDENTFVPVLTPDDSGYFKKFTNTTTTSTNYGVEFTTDYAYQNKSDLTPIEANYPTYGNMYFQLFKTDLNTLKYTIGLHWSGTKKAYTATIDSSILDEALKCTHIMFGPKYFGRSSGSNFSALSVNTTQESLKYNVNTNLKEFAFDKDISTLVSTTDEFNFQELMTSGENKIKLEQTITHTLLLDDSVTLQGNTFNSANQLVKLDSSGKLPAIDGSQLTNLPETNSFNAINMDTNDFNTYIKAGVYHWSAYTTAANNPSGNYKGFLQVLVKEDGNSPVTQIFTLAESLDTSTAPSMWIRYCNSGKSTGYSWSSWVKVNNDVAPINTLLKIDTTGLNTTINTGTTKNLLDLVSLTGSTTNVVTTANISATNYSLSGGILKLPYLPTINNKYSNTYCDYAISVRLTGTIAGSANTSREFSIELQRANDNSIVERRAIIKITDTTLSSRGTTFETYTLNSTDPFIENGLKLVLNNNSSQTITLTGVSIMIKGRTY